MKPDLDNYTLEELTSLKEEIETAIRSINERSLAHVRKELEKIAESMGYKIDEVLEMRKARVKGDPKYCNPDKPEQTWTGRGRKPKWVKYALESGKVLDDLRI